MSTFLRLLFGTNKPKKRLATADAEDEPLFRGGIPNPGLAGRSIHYPLSGSDPDPDRISEAARRLGRPIIYRDDDGYEHEIVSATPVGPNGELAYVECASKQLKKFVAVNFKFVVREASGKELESDIKSYNPFFGCDVRFLEWSGNTAILIYKEKHSTYIANGTSKEPARYVAIADQWVISGSEIGYWRYKEHHVRRLQLPELAELEPLSEADAVAKNVCPEKYW